MHKRGIVVAGLLLTSAYVLYAAEEAPKDIKAVMANHKKDQLRQQIGDAVKKDTVEWEAVQKQTKSYAEQAAALPKFEPKKGEKEEFKKKATAFAEAVGELDKAAKAKDAKAANAAMAKSGGMCMGCHKDHR